MPERKLPVKPEGKREEAPLPETEVPAPTPEGVQGRSKEGVPERSESQSEVPGPSIEVETPPAPIAEEPGETDKEKPVNPAVSKIGTGTPEGAADLEEAVREKE